MNKTCLAAELEHNLLVWLMTEYDFVRCLYLIENKLPNGKIPYAYD